MTDALPLCPRCQCYMPADKYAWVMAEWLEPCEDGLTHVTGFDFVCSSECAAQMAQAGGAPIIRDVARVVEEAFDIADAVDTAGGA